MSDAKPYTQADWARSIVVDFTHPSKPVAWNRNRRCCVCGDVLRPQQEMCMDPMRFGATTTNPKDNDNG